VGVYRYTEASDFEILMIAYALDEKVKQRQFRRLLSLLVQYQMGAHPGTQAGQSTFDKKTK